MYSWIWRHLPGPTAAKLFSTLVLFAIVVFLLFQYVFPWLEPIMPFSGNTVTN